MNREVYLFCSVTLLSVLYDVSGASVSVFMAASRVGPEQAAQGCSLLCVVYADLLLRSLVNHITVGFWNCSERHLVSLGVPV